MPCALAQDVQRDLELAQATLQQTREQLADRHAAVKRMEHRTEVAESTVSQLRREAADTSGELAQVLA